MKKEIRLIFIPFIYLIIIRIILSIALPLAFFSRGLLLDVLFLSILFALIELFKSSRIKKIMYSLMLAFWTLLMIADIIYYDYFYTLGSKSSLQGITLLSRGLTIEYNLEIPFELILVLIGLVGFIAAIVFVKSPQKPIKFLKWIAIVSLTLNMIILGYFYLRNESDSIEYYESDAYLYRSMYDRLRFSERYGYFYYHIIDLVRPLPIVNEEEAIAELDSYFSENKMHQENAYTNQFEDHNVILITVESLDIRFANEIISPTLFNMMQEGYRYDNFYVPVFQQGATCNSEYMALTGLLAINSNDWSNNICDAYNKNAFPYAMPNQLKNAGYNTFYFHGGHEWFYQREVMMQSYGFDTIKFQEDLYESGYTDYTDRYDRHLMRFVDEYASFEEPFYMQFLTYALHGAYNHEEYAKYDDIVSQVYDDSIDSEIRVYLQKLAEFDAFLTLLTERLDTEGVLDSTLIVIHADHYPYMMDENTYSNYLDIDMNSHELYKQSLVIYNPHMTPTVFNGVGSTIDIAPTLLNLIYPEAEFTYFTGKDLANEDNHFVLLHDLSITDGNTRYYLHKPYNGPIEDEETLKSMLARNIRLFELQKALLNIDYFRYKNE
ncbi:MAG: LTA synthase family protein [Candidatus Izemoplasmataceae bacterium]